MFLVQIITVHYSCSSTATTEDVKALIPPDYNFPLGIRNPIEELQMLLNVNKFCQKQTNKIKQISYFISTNSNYPPLEIENFIALFF